MLYVVRELWHTSVKWYKIVWNIQFFHSKSKYPNKFGISLFFTVFVSAQIEMVPQNYQKLESDEHVKLMEKMIEIMEDDDDVQNVWHNWEE